MSRRARLAALVAAAALAAAGAVLVSTPSPASAHDFLESTNPAADQVVTEALPEVSLTFNEPPLSDLGAGIAVEVHAPDGSNVAGELAIVNSTLSVPVTWPAAGGYTVLWQTVSSDGHPVSGEFGFEYQGPVTAPVTPTPTPTPSAPGSAPASTTQATPETGAASDAAMSTPAASPGDEGVSVPLVLAGVAAAVVVLGVVLAVVLTASRRCRPGGPSAG
ncbi:copper resistance protein CopC [Herbiconiux moechotypicola]|nr:copper resistance CopC family protein [Herbiconiux moechotypicola]MCS5728989.1 copper resistance protein CopC [Herbiconiux moechotypicola]